MTTTTEQDRICKLLPFDGRMALVTASKTPGGAMMRLIEIERVTMQVRAKFPDWFVAAFDLQANSSEESIKGE